VNLIGCLDRPSSGEILLDGVNVANIAASELNRVRAEKIGYGPEARTAAIEGAKAQISEVVGAELAKAA